MNIQAEMEINIARVPYAFMLLMLFMLLSLVQQVMEAHLLKLLMGIREWGEHWRHKLGSGQSCSTPRLFANRNSHFLFILMVMHHEGLCAVSLQL